MPSQSQLPWQDPDWMKQAHGWIQAETARRSIRIMGDIQQPHLYPWSTVLIVPTSEGRLFFKTTAPETIYEAALTQKLAEWRPNCLPELVAVDPVRGWMLMRDGGEQLRQSIRPAEDIEPWAPVILRYAELQIELAKHVPEILALGIPDHRPAVLPPLYSWMLADEESMMIDQEKGLTSAEFQQLRELDSHFQQICATLAAIGIPDSLNHGDFHDGNVLLRNGRITFFDWGDASVTHPFVSLRTFFVSIEISLKLDDYSFTPEMAALLDRYLEPWQKYASRDGLLNAYRFSKPVASIARALAWHQTISRLDGFLREQYAWIVPELMKEFLVQEKRLSD
jgi:hypothetical protein